MRGQSIVGLLMYEAKIKPHIKELVDRIDDLTDEEIETANVPLPWFRQALRQLRAERAAEQQSSRILDQASYTTPPEPFGYTAEWNGEMIFAKISDTMSIEVSPQTLLFFPEEGGVWIGSTRGMVIDARFKDLTPIEKMTRRDYILAYKQRLLGKL